MDDALLVGGGERLRERDGDLEDALQGHPAFGNHVREPLALDELHGEEVNAPGLLDRVNGDDIRMVEGSERLRFALESLQALLGARQLGRQDLEGYVPLELGVLRPVHLTHTAFTQLGGNAIVQQRLADHAGADHAVAVLSAR